MRTALRGLVLPILLLSLARPVDAVEAPRLFDTLVAVVTPPGLDGRGGRTVITLGDLELETRIAVIARGGLEAASGPIPEATLARSLDWLIAEHLLVSEAEGLAVAGVDPAEVERAVAAFRDRFPAVEVYRRFLVDQELTEAELARSLRRSLLAARYLDSRARLAVQVGDEQVRRAFEERRGELGGKSFEEARAALRLSLEREAREKLVAAMVADLRARAEVRILHELDAEGR